MTSSVTNTSLNAFIREKASEYLKRSSDDIALDHPLSEYGIDSVAAVSLCADIEDFLDIDIEPTLAWDHPTIEKMTSHLMTQI